MEFLRDPFWQFIITIVVAIIGVIAAFSGIQRNKKRLSYEILASNELLTASEEIAGRLKILFDNQLVQNVHLLVVKFINDGNVPILETDFYESVTVRFGKDTRILSAELIENNPESIRISFAAD